MLQRLAQFLLLQMSRNYSTEAKSYQGLGADGPSPTAFEEVCIKDVVREGVMHQI